MTLPPKCAPHPASATAPQPPLFIVSVSCLLVLSAATLRQKPAKPANSPRRTKYSAILNSLPFPAPCSRHYHLPHSPFPRGGSRNRPKIGQLFIGWGELWGHHKPPGVPVVERQNSLQLFFLPPGNCLVKGATLIEKAESPSPHSFLQEFSLRHRLLGF